MRHLNKNLKFKSRSSKSNNGSRQKQMLIKMKKVRMAARKAINRSGLRLQSSLTRASRTR